MSPEIGRFISKDPLPGDVRHPLSMNEWLYAEADPVNRVDPAGYFSNEAIAATFGVDNFDQVMDIFQQTGKWGFLRLLQDAQEGDILEVGYEGKPIIEEGRFRCRNGRIDGVYIYDFKNYLERLERAHYELVRWWRSTTLDWYFLNGGGPGKSTLGAPAWWKGGYTDWKDWTDLPDFYMTGYSVRAPVETAGLTYIVDRYGRRYLSGALGISAGPIPFDVSYAEGYIGPWNYGSGPIVVKSSPATREEIEEFLIGFGETVYADVGIGGGVSISFGGAATLFGEGLFGISWTASATIFLDATENPDLAWDWLDHVSGIQKSDILLNNNASGCDCQ